LVSRALPGGEDNPDFEAVFASFSAYYDVHCLDKTAPYEGIMELLAALHEKGVKMAIVTNKYQTAAEELRQKFFADYIPIIEGDVAGRERKPDPAPVRAALKALDAEGESAVYIGDTEVDMATARNSGLDFIAVEWGYRTLDQLKALGIEKIALKLMDVLGLI
ncbi:MAG: HAD-IA family hydrolase, partial [Oscillospiraceae bacterium]|nr:HAD-IA family hydrolase [Oscillospiraceae bacterium]